MEFITLNNGVKMPAEGIGTFLLTPDKAETAVLSALKDGARLIDTANAYMNERAVGRAIAKSGIARGKKAVIADGGACRGLDGEQGEEESKEEKVFLSF